MFKYFWIILLAVPYIIWAIFSIYDFYKCINRRGFDGLYDVSEASWGWLVTLVIALFVMSFVDWAMQIANS